MALHRSNSYSTVSQKSGAKETSLHHKQSCARRCFRSTIFPLIPICLVMGWFFRYPQLQWTADLHTVTARATAAVDLITKSSFLSLVMVPIEPYQACEWRIQKIVCKFTILSETNDVLPLPQATDARLKESICEDLISTANVSAEVVEVPVCIQNSNTQGVLAYYQEFTENGYVFTNIQKVEDHTDLAVNQFVRTNSALSPRIVKLKTIDFPYYYRRAVFGWEYEKYRDTNFGNMVWRYASTMLLNPLTNKYQTSIDENWGSEVGDSRNKTAEVVDAVVIATANTLHLSKEPQLQDLIQSMTKRVVSRNVPTVVIGLGIQSEFGNDKNQTLNISTILLPHDYQKQLLQEITLRQRAPAIGVRGDLTAAVCKNAGVTHCVSMGCPSLTISRDANLGKTLHQNWDRVYEILKEGKSGLKIALTAPAFTTRPVSKSVLIVLELMANVLQEYGNQVTVIAQTPRTSKEVNGFVENEWRTIFPTTTLTNVSKIQYEEFPNVERWLEGAKKFDICISSRIHGSMTFISSGVPTIAIPTDFRIMELIESMKIPFVLPETILNLMSGEGKLKPSELVKTLMESAENTNFSIFESNRRMKIRGWQTILNDAGLEMNPTLVKIANSPL